MWPLGRPAGPAPPACMQNAQVALGVALPTKLMAGRQWQPEAAGLSAVTATGRHRRPHRALHGHCVGPAGPGRADRNAKRHWTMQIGPTAADGVGGHRTWALPATPAPRRQATGQQRAADGPKPRAAVASARQRPLHIAYIDPGRAQRAVPSRVRLGDTVLLSR